MSGPKLSEAELERLRQEQLERERQEALKKLMDARRQYTGVCDEVRLIKNSLLQSFNKIDAVYRSNIESEIMTLLNDVADKPIMSSNPEDYLSATKNLSGRISSWKRKIEVILSSAQDKINNENDISDRNASLQSISLDDLKCTGEIEPMYIDFSCQYDMEYIKKILLEAKKHYEQRIKSQSEPRLLSFDKKALQAILQMLDKSLSLDEVKKRIQQITNEEENQIRLLKQFDAWYEEYEAISMILGIVPKEKDEMKLEILKNEIDNLKKEYKCRDEMDFIADQINEVMIEQGYSFVSSKVLTKKDMGETEYSLYQDEDKSGIAVYTDESGAVMMRMTVLGDGNEITDADREFSYQSQIDFCSRHAELVEALAERGVYLKQKSYQAPDRKHTYKVNVSDRMSTSSSTTTSKSNSKVQKVDRRARRRGGNKKMRSM